MGENDRAEIVEKARQQIKRWAFEDPVNREQFQRYLAIAGPLLDELAQLGYEIDTLDDLRHRGKPWKTALPVLLRWLPKIEDPSVKVSIVRCLSVPWGGNKATAELIEEFRKYAPILSKLTNLWVGNRMREIPEEQKKLGPYFNLAWAIGNALSIVDVKGFERQIVELCRNPKYGAARQMLVLGLGRFHNSEAEGTALDLLNDEQVQVHAIGALAKMKSKRALFELEKLMTDKRAAIRKEARKAITKIMR
jgi:HEAT repeat protein